MLAVITLSRTKGMFTKNFDVSSEEDLDLTNIENDIRNTYDHLGVGEIILVQNDEVLAMYVGGRWVDNEGEPV